MDKIAYIISVIGGFFVGNGILLTFMTVNNYTLNLYNIMILVGLNTIYIGFVVDDLRGDRW